jgi:ATP sulfurylase
VGKCVSIASQVVRIDRAVAVHGDLDLPTHRIITEEKTSEVHNRESELPRLKMFPTGLLTVRRIDNGTSSPLRNPMNLITFYWVPADERILSRKNYHLRTILTDFPTSDNEKRRLSGRREAFVTNPQGGPIAPPSIENIYNFDSKIHLESVYDTD